MDGLTNTVSAKVDELHDEMFASKKIKTWFIDKHSIDDVEDAVELANRTILKVDMSLAENI